MAVINAIGPCTRPVRLHKPKLCDNPVLKRRSEEAAYERAQNALWEHRLQSFNEKGRKKFPHVWIDLPTQGFTHMLIEYWRLYELHLESPYSHTQYSSRDIWSVILDKRIADPYDPLYPWDFFINEPLAVVAKQKEQVAYTVEVNLDGDVIGTDCLDIGDPLFKQYESRAGQPFWQRRPVATGILIALALFFGGVYLVAP